MSGRHSGGTGSGLRISALPQTLKMIFKLAPRQLSDEIALAKAEIKRKGTQLGVAGAFFAVALVFVGLLVIGLFIAAIMGLATIMPAWLAALLVSAVCLIIAAIGALIGQNKFKKVMPLVPEDTIRGLKYDLGIAKEGSAFDASRSWIRTPSSTKPRRPPRKPQPPKRRRKRKQRLPPSPTSDRRPQRLNSDAGWTSGARTLPACATTSAVNSMSRPRPRSCWRPPRPGSRTARSSSATRSQASAPQPAPRRGRPHPLTGRAWPTQIKRALEAPCCARRLWSRPRGPGAQADKGLGRSLNLNAKPLPSTERGNR